MDPMAVDMLGCLDGDQCSDKTQLADALGAEVKEIIGCQAADRSLPSILWAALEMLAFACLFDSEVSQSSKMYLDG